MKHFSSLIGMLSLLAYAAAAFYGPQPQATQIGRRRSQSAYRAPGPGKSYAHTKRMARKAKNVQRNRAAHRRAS